MEQSHLLQKENNHPLWRMMIFSGKRVEDLCPDMSEAILYSDSE